MTELLFTVFIVVITAVISLALAAPQSGGRRLMLVGLCAATLVLTGVVTQEFLGRPKPIVIEWRAGEATVLAHEFDEGEAIYLWLLWPSEDFPRAYVLPWDARTAREITEAQEGVEQDGGALVTTVAGDRSERPGERQQAGTDGSIDASLGDRDLMFYAVPHPKPPDKPEADTARSTRFVHGDS